MLSTFKKYLEVWHTVAKATQNAYSPMYRTMASLFILLTGAILKSIRFDGADAIIYLGAIATFITALKASFFYYRKSNQLEKRLNEERS